MTSVDFGYPFPRGLGLGIYKRSLRKIIEEAEACIEIRIMNRIIKNEEVKIIKDGKTTRKEMYDKIFTASDSIKILKRGKAGFFVGKFFGKMGKFSWAGVMVYADVNPIYGGEYSLCENDLEELKTIYNKLLCERKNPKSKVSMITERFLLSVSGGLEKHIRPIVFFPILESLYLPEEPEGELSFRLSHRIAYSLFPREQRFEKYKEIKNNLYKKRSILIHQLKDTFSEDELNMLEDLTRRSIKLFLRNPQFFTPENLEEIIFKK